MKRNKKNLIIYLILDYLWRIYQILKHLDQDSQENLEHVN